ncbi:MAG: transposase [Eubacteriaceae bacterium]|nr:transposase [Eubacteriaceae bacterium]
MINIPLNSQIAKRLERLAIYEASQQKKAMLAGRIMAAMILPGYCGKLSGIERRTGLSRETYGYMLRDNSWDDSPLGGYAGITAAEKAFSAAQGAGKPVVVCLDGTINTREAPRSGTTSPSEGMGFHYSHKDKKKVYGCQTAGMLIGAMGSDFLCHGFRIYGKTKSKIELARELISCLPEAETVSCAVSGCWYANKNIIPEFWAKGYEVVCALKTNRIIYPAGHRIQIKDFSKLVEKNECCLVTANSKKYYIYKLETRLAGIENPAVLISWPEDGFGNEKAMRAFLCSDVFLSGQEIIHIYTQRWDIEVFFKECKNTFGAKKIMLRTICGIRRRWLIAALAHNFCVSEGGSFLEGRAEFIKNEFENRGDLLYELAYTLPKNEFAELYSKIA